MGIPAWLAWLLPIPGVTLAAVAWSSWTGRSRGPGRPELSMSAHRRYRDALAPSSRTRPEPRRRG